MPKPKKVVTNIKTAKTKKDLKKRADPIREDDPIGTKQPKSSGP
jgi:hypothetical protein